ncbi:hypothetical protein [Catellatospora vulcania]|uniref:hypothetical protein n=1 Tax=Catellatospora vulcania TaxID=1460450 RepID=UPI0018B00F78|nr:hypothetical protein [Catellatospora vulcania]
MGTSAVYRIHTGDDVVAVHAMARRLLDRRSTGCCRAYVAVDVEVDTHRDLARYLTLGSAYLVVTLPAELVEQATPVLGPHLSAADRWKTSRDGSLPLMIDFDGAVVTALRRLPPLECRISTYECELEDDPAGSLLSAVGSDPASVLWRVCWPGEHKYAGFELGLNGIELYHRDPPPGHSLYLHVRSNGEELAQALATTVGAGAVGDAALGR